jgi:hypothetical protein
MNIIGGHPPGSRGGYSSGNLKENEAGAGGPANESRLTRNLSVVETTDSDANVHRRSTET